MNKNKMGLISELRKNGRKKLTEISRKLGIPVSTLFDTIHALEREGVVEHKMLVDFEKLGFPIRIMAVLKTELRERESLKDYLSGQKSVNSIFEIDSGHDYLIEGVFRNQKEYQDFMNDMEINNMIMDKMVFNVVDIVHNEKFLSDGKHFHNKTENNSESAE